MTHGERVVNSLLPNAVPAAIYNPYGWKCCRHAHIHPKRHSRNRPLTTSRPTHSRLLLEFRPLSLPIFAFGCECVSQCT